MRAAGDGHHTQCKSCKIRYSRSWYARNRDKVLEYQREYRQAHPEKAAQWRMANPHYVRDRERERSKDPEYRKARALRRARHHHKLRLEVISRLGGCCTQCGFSDFGALQIDHIEGGGNKELSEIPRTMYLRKILKDAKGYQLLCANCNWIKRWENGEHHCTVRVALDQLTATC